VNLQVKNKINNTLGHGKQRVFIYILVAVILFTVINNYFFLHTHKLPDGRVVAHAHPFKSDKSSNNVNHQHSEAELLFIHLINNLLFALIFLLILLLNTLTLSTFYYKKTNLRFSHKSCCERAPPILI
jgi:hypothetical protein